MTSRSLSPPPQRGRKLARAHATHDLSYPTHTNMAEQSPTTPDPPLLFTVSTVPAVHDAESVPNAVYVIIVVAVWVAIVLAVILIRKFAADSGHRIPCPESFRTCSCCDCSDDCHSCALCVEGALKRGRNPIALQKISVAGCSYCCRRRKSSSSKIIRSCHLMFCCRRRRLSFFS